MEVFSKDQLIDVTIPVGNETVYGNLYVPTDALGLVLFAHGSGSSRFSKRNRYVAENLNDAGLATLLFDLLTEEEEQVDIYTREFRFDIPRLSERLVAATDWVLSQPDLKDFSVGYFGSSTGAAAALIAAANRVDNISAVVSRGGRPDLGFAVGTQNFAPVNYFMGTTALLNKSFLPS